MPIVSPTFLIRKLRLSEDKSFSQGHFSNEEAESRFKTQMCLTPESGLVTSMLLVIQLIISTWHAQNNQKFYKIVGRG